MKLLAAISHHGLGHLAQAAPVLNALRETHPGIALTVWSGLAESALRARLQPPFRHRAEAADIGLLMRDAVRVDVDSSRRAYLDFHRDWSARVANEAAWLRAQAFDAVFSDVAYLPLAAAAQAAIPAAALCSLNWYDIATAYLADHADMEAPLRDMRAAYQAAAMFLCPQPSMPMHWLEHRLDLPPIAARGVARRRALAQGARGGQRERLVLVGFGGIGYQGVGRLPKLPGITWIVPDEWATSRDDAITLGSLNMPFLDVLASCDALITKVGYGGFTEAAAHGVPVLYVDRPDWPETPYLSAWLAQQGNCAAIDEGEMFSAALGSRLDRLWALPEKPVAVADGAHAAVDHLLRLFG